MELQSLYEDMALIRRFEERLLELFSEGLLAGTTHTYIGQEANAVAIIKHLIKSDIIFSNHRCHGHFLARTKNILGLLSEIMGKKSGVCAGKGGSQHLYQGNFYSSGIQGGFVPIAMGMAFVQKWKKEQGITVAFIGDGTLGHGPVYESMNIASLQQVPLLLVVENNNYAQTTSIEMNLAGNIVDRFKAFDIDAGEIDSTNVLELYEHFGPIISKVRETKSPHVEVIHTYRLRGHSKGDDFRDPEEINERKKLDPLVLAEQKLNENTVNEIKERVYDMVDKAEKTIKASL